MYVMDLWRRPWREGKRSDWSRHVEEVLLEVLVFCCGPLLATAGRELINRLRSRERQHKHRFLAVRLRCEHWEGRRWLEILKRMSRSRLQPEDLCLGNTIDTISRSSTIESSSLHLLLLATIFSTKYTSATSRFNRSLALLPLRCCDVKKIIHLSFRSVCPLNAMLSREVIKPLKPNLT